MRAFSFILTFVFLQIENTALSQDDSIRIKQLVDKLSWNNIAMDCMGGTLVLTHDDSLENELFQLGPLSSRALLNALDSPNKTVIAHIILSRLYEDSLFLGLSGTVYIYKDCQNLIGWHNIFNGIVWEWYEGKKNQIEKSEIDKIKKYWIDKLINKRHVDRFDDSRIFEELKTKDSLKYPCSEKSPKKEPKKRSA